MPSTTLPPPLGGWNTFDGLVGMDPQYAPVLDNMLPEQGRLRVRPGYRVWASGLPGRVDGLLSYRSGTTSYLFASSGAGIYDVTGAGPVGAAVVSGLTDARWDGLNVAAAGGSFLLAFNGVDAERVFNGSGWGPWTATGLPGPANSEGIARVGWATVFKGQLFAGRRDRLSFFYSVPGAIGGAFTEFPLQSIAKRGGGIAGALGWTLDSGTGPDDLLALVTTEGEVVVYRGTNPSSADSWALVGVFSLPRPVGSRFLRPFGGTVLVLTEGGVFSLAAVVEGTDEAALASKAFTRAIEPTFLQLARGRGAVPGWDMVSITALGLWLVNLPLGSGDAQQIVFRAANGAAARMTGLAAACWLTAGSQVFFGHASAGKVLVWGDDVSDDGAAIRAECVQAFSEFGTPGVLKRFTLLQPLLGDADNAAVRAEMALDWRVPPPDADAGVAPMPAPAAALVWDVGLWDVGAWAGGDGEVTRAWRAARGIGPSGAVRLRTSSAGSRPEWLGTGIVWDRGGPLR